MSLRKTRRYFYEKLKTESIKISFSNEKRIDQKYEIDGSISRKLGSGCSSVSISKDDHMLKVSLEREENNLC